MSIQSEESAIIPVARHVYPSFFQAMSSCWGDVKRVKMWRCADKERVMQRRALLTQLGLPTDYYLTLARALPSTLLAATAVCLMPDEQAYELLTSSHGPGGEASRAQGDGSAQPGSTGHENHSSDAANGLSDQVPGTVEVRAAPTLQEQGVSRPLSCYTLCCAHLQQDNEGNPIGCRTMATYGDVI